MVATKKRGSKSKVGKIGGAPIVRGNVTRGDVPTLWQDEADAIYKIRGGADIYDYGLAKVLRDIQRRGLPVNDLKASPPSIMSGWLFAITKPMMYKGGGAGRMPYFGAIASPLGLKAARKCRVDARKLRAV